GRESPGHIHAHDSVRSNESPSRWGRLAPADVDGDDRSGQHAVPAGPRDRPAAAAAAKRSEEMVKTLPRLSITMQPCGSSLCRADGPRNKSHGVVRANERAKKKMPWNVPWCELPRGHQ